MKLLTKKSIIVSVYVKELRRQMQMVDNETRKIFHKLAKVLTLNLYHLHLHTLLQQDHLVEVDQVMVEPAVTFK